MVLLETYRFYIRNVLEKDAEIMFDYRNNYICEKYQRYDTKDKENLVKLVEKMKNTELSMGNNLILAISDKKTDEMLGEIVVMPFEDKIFLGYTISYKYHRLGIAFEVLSSFINFLHKEYSRNVFICLVEEGNIPSMKLLEKLGYENKGFDYETQSILYKKEF